jgi:hypothetical protein
LDKLRKGGLAAFPRPFADENVAQAVNIQNEGRGPAHLTTAEQMGLLAPPSDAMTKAKEAAESAKLRAEAEKAKAEQEKARLELARIQREQEAERTALVAQRQAEAEERRARHQADRERRRQEVGRKRQEARAREEYERRKKWLSEQCAMVLREADYDLYKFVRSWSQRDATKERIVAEVLREMDSLTPDSLESECQRARKAAVERVLAPYRREYVIEDVLSGFFGGEISKYLDKLHEQGWITLGDQEREFFKKRWEPYIRAELKGAWSCRGELSEEEARQVVRHAIDKKLGIARRSTPKGNV